MLDRVVLSFVPWSRAGVSGGWIDVDIKRPGLRRGAEESGSVSVEYMLYGSGFVFLHDYGGVVASEAE